MDALPEKLLSTVLMTAKAHGVSADAFDIIRISSDGEEIAFLSYPGFFDDGFPTLTRSIAVNVRTNRITRRDYPVESNPPVLHRKELLLPVDHPRQAEFADLTRAAEEAGLFEDRAIIGHLVQWEETLRSKGLAVKGNRLVARDAAPSADDAAERVLRHRTALRRNALSTPMQALLRYGFLSTEHSIFDYGCGRGDDVAELRARGLQARGWDPHFAPGEECVPAQVVNLGFVLNVIEDIKERREALEGAFRLTEKVLAVAVLIGGRTAYERYRLYRDGVLTSRGTFQKYFSQEELRDYLAECLRREPVAVAPGIFFIFKEDTDEQAFLADRQRLARQWTFLPHAHTARRERAPSMREPRAPRLSKWEAHRELLDAFWARCLALGRVPESDELEGLTRLQVLGRPATIVRRLSADKGDAVLARARMERVDDLLVFLALNIFERRKSLSAFSGSLQRDIKAFFGNYSQALAHAREALFSLGEVETVAAASRRASESAIGFLDDDGNLQLHSSLVSRLPAALRIYVGCAARLYGGIENADVVKIHVGSGKLTLTLYDDFDANALPELIERVKIDMRNQEIRFYQYGSTGEERQLLYLKSRYMTPGMDRYEEQLRFDEQMRALDGISLAGYGPPAEVFWAELQRRGVRVDGFALRATRSG